MEMIRELAPGLSNFIPDFVPFLVGYARRAAPWAAARNGSPR